MNAEKGKKTYLIITTRTEYQRCHYLVEAQSREQASLLFDQGRADSVETNLVDADETIEEVEAHETRAAVIAP